METPGTKLTEGGVRSESVRFYPGSRARTSSPNFATE